MAGYKEHIYLQKMSDGSVRYDTIEQWGFWGKEIPFKIAGESKELYSNDWHDEDGEDEYIPKELKLKSYEMEVEFGHRYYAGDKKSEDTTKSDLTAFLNYLTGKDGSGVELMIYSTWTGVGRQKVRFVSIDDNAEFVKDSESCALMVKVKFKVNDPTTEIIPFNGKLTKA